MAASTPRLEKKPFHSQVDIFRAILETLEVLKLDLANTLIAMIRPHVQKESVHYERAKFDEMLKVSEGIYLFPSCSLLPLTFKLKPKN